MDYYECSAKTNYNIDKIFTESASKISDGINNGEFDLISGNNGIKMGIGAKEYKQKIQLNSNKNNKEGKTKKKCCWFLNLVVDYI